MVEAIWFLRLENWSIVIFMVIIALVEVRVIRERVFFVWRRLVGRLVITIMMRLGVNGVVFGIVVAGIERIVLLVFFVMSVRVVDVLHGVLRSKVSASLQTSPRSGTHRWLRL